jgi:beta-glucanase (GH16 family)
VNHTLYDGNATQYDFTLDSGSLYNLNTSSELALLLTETNGGTRISSTRYLQYGTVTTRLKTTKWAGVVTAAITMSDVKDEIDWEWPGAQTLQAQSNYFWLGQVNYPPTSGKTETVSNDSYSNYHDYTVDWQEDELNFSIDGKNVRTIKKSDTIDSSGRAQYPTTPARIQVSVWPAGINTSAEGTVKWAGGMINWNDPDYSAAGGHFAAVLQSVTIKCGSSSNTSLPNTPRSYVYAGNNSQGIPVAYISNATTLLNGAMGRVKVGAGVWSATCVGLMGVAIGMLLGA